FLYCYVRLYVKLTFNLTFIEGDKMTQQTGIYHVEPLRTAEEINEMKLAIKRGNKGTPKRPKLANRDVLIILIGINTRLRVNNLLRLKVSDVKYKDDVTLNVG